MPIKFERVKKGDLLWDVRTAHGQVRTYQVKVLEIDHEKGHASCSWNNSKPTYYSKGQIERLRRRRPKVRTWLKTDGANPKFERFRGG